MVKAAVALTLIAAVAVGAARPAAVSSAQHATAATAPRESESVEDALPTSRIESVAAPATARQAGKASMAFDEEQRAPEADPANESAYVGLGMALVAAEQRYRAALERDPRDVAACVGLGRILRRRSPRDSAKALEQAVEIDPHDVEAHVELAVTDSHLLSFGEARRHAEIALGLDPRGPRAHELIELLGVIDAMQSPR